MAIITADQHLWLEPEPPAVDLRQLVGHRSSVQADQTVGEVFNLFAHHGFEFMAILESSELIGLCSKRDIGMLLGSQYGFALYAQKPIREHMKPAMACIQPDAPLHEVFRLVFAREGEHFYDDVLLVEQGRKFIGLIFTHTLIKLQNLHHLQSIRLLERQRREISLKNAQIETDLRMSRELQQAFLPDAYPVFPAQAAPADSRLRFSHYYRPYDLVGGDFFHVKQVTDACAGIFIADVMGHGVRAALITAMLRALLDEMGDEFTAPERLLGALNCKLLKILTKVSDGVIFATAFYLLVDIDTRKLRYASAGHPPPIHLQPSLGQAHAIQHPDAGPMLGVFADAAFASAEIAYAPGDAMILYTDGIMEVENIQGQAFGQESLLAAVRERLDRPVAEIFQALLAQTQDFARRREFSDDVCLLAVEMR